MHAGLLDLSRSFHASEGRPAGPEPGLTIGRRRCRVVGMQRRQSIECAAVLGGVDVPTRQNALQAA